MKVAIIGGGIAGLATALELRDRGAHVIVLERGLLGGEASSAAAGILGAQVEASGPGALFGQLVEARGLYRPWVEALEGRTGIRVGYRESGALKLAVTEDDEKAIRDIIAWQRAAGQRAEWLGAQAACTVEPLVSPAVAGAAYFPDDAQVEPARLLAAVVTAARAAGVEMRAPENVRRVLVEGDRARGVETERGNLLCDAVVVAAGSWSSLLPGVPSAVRVRPVRGQMLKLREPIPALRTVLVGPGAYVVPRGEGALVCGSTMEDVGYTRAVTASGVRKILDGVMAMAPELGAAALEGTWCGFRPASEGGLPLVGATPMPQLFAATGHHRNGILLARWTAVKLAEAVLG